MGLGDQPVLKTCILRFETHISILLSDIKKSLLHYHIKEKKICKMDS